MYDVMSCMTCHMRRNIECDMLRCATRCRIRFNVEWKLMSSAIRCHLQFDVVCGHFKRRLGLGHDEVFSNHETTYNLARKRVSCATFEGKVVCVLVKASSCATSEGKVVCDLGVQVAHEGNSYVECACGIGVEPNGLDTMSSTELNTW